MTILNIMASTSISLYGRKGWNDFKYSKGYNFSSGFSSCIECNDNNDSHDVTDLMAKITVMTLMAIMASMALMTIMAVMVLNI